MRALVVFLCAVAASFATAADEQPAISAPAEVAATPAPAPVTWKHITLANPNCQLVISDFRASIASFGLTGTHPIRLPEWKQKQLKREAVDRQAPLDVLANFNPSGDMHNFIGDGNLEVPGGRPSEGPWKVVDGGGPRLLTMTSSYKHVDYSMSYRLAEAKPEVLVELVMVNAGDQDVSLNPTIRAISGIHQDDPTLDGQYLAVAAHRGGDEGSQSAEHPSGTTIKALGDGTALDYVAVRDRFFAAFWEPKGCLLDGGLPESTASPVVTTVDPARQAPVVAGAQCSIAVSTSGFARPVGKQTENQAMVWVDYHDPSGKPFVLKPKQRLKLSWSLAVTSLRKSDLALFSDAEQQIQYTDSYYRFFKSLAKLLTICLEGLALVVRNYGVALLILTFLLKAALHRFTVKQMTSMMKMQKLAPQLKYMQEQYKGDRQEMARKQMELYKKHGVNPLGGCLPMLVQIPVFIALYQAFLHSVEMRGQSFLWVADLTMPDQLIYLGFNIPAWMPLFGNIPATINPLPIIYIAATIWMSFSQKMPTGGDPAQEQTMKMMRWMPVFFGLIFYNMSAGLVLYFTANAIFSTIETRMVRRKLGMDQPNQQPSPTR